MKELLIVCPELPPFTPATDEGETISGLAQALRAEGLSVNVVSLMRPGIEVDSFGLARRLEPLEISIAGRQEKVVLFEGKFPASDARVVLLDHEQLTSAPVNADADAVDEPTFGRAFLLAAGALALAERFDWSPDVVHAFGWQAGLTPLLLKRRAEGDKLAGVPSVFTVFDPAARGLFDPALLERFAIGFDLFHPEGIEFHQQASLLKAGLVCADRITLPGPSATIACQAEASGFGLHGLWSRLAEQTSGVISGVDEHTNDPTNDRRLASHYAADDLSGKASCRRAAELALGLEPDHRRPLVLLDATAGQEEGLELMLDAAVEWVPLGVRLVLIGQVSEAAAGRIATIVSEHPQSLVHFEDAPAGALPLLAGADVVMLPMSRDTATVRHLRALRYGTVPMVPANTALGDAIVDFDRETGSGTGLVFSALDGEAMLTTLQSLVEIYADRPRWRTLVANAMGQQWPHKLSAWRMQHVYELALGSNEPEAPATSDDEADAAPAD